MKTRSDYADSGVEDATEVKSSTQKIVSIWLRAKNFSFLDVLVLFFLYVLLLGGFTQQLNSDAAKYQCYAFAFWHGTQALQALPAQQCSFLTHPTDQQTVEAHDAFIKHMQHYNLPGGLITFIATQLSTLPYHVLPYEYPLLAVLSFSSGLITPPGWYQEAFAFWLLCIATGLYVLLLRVKSRGTALAFAIYLAAGCFVTALGRFDLLPTMCTFGALLCAEHFKWRWAFFLLALATMLKFYPIVLLPPLLLAQQRQQKGTWHTSQRYLPLGIFSTTCVLIVILSLMVNVEGTIGPLTYFGQRPLQIESVPASLVWLVSTPGGYPLDHTFSFGSRNVLSPFSALAMQMDSIIALAGLCFVYWLQWRQKIALPLTCLLTLLIVLVTGKVFSAQYLIWVAPFVAYVGGWSWQWISGWGGISIVTTLIYPFLYNRVRYSFEPLLPDLYLTIFVRDALLLLFTCLLLWLAARDHFRVDA
ncbi:MAG: hypothetical protein NVS2B12_00740 [Ktedonobacteraceae bacterium]